MVDTQAPTHKTIEETPLRGELDLQWRDGKVLHVMPDELPGLSEQTPKQQR